jgi:tripartite-type tricarboxylate transporter receptor subunit TctC
MTHQPQRRQLLTCAAGGLAAGLAWPVMAQSGPWPNRPIKWIVSQPAGAGPDILARYIADQLARSWGSAVVVENRPGGQNVIGTQAAARSAPDGYNFFYATTAAMVTNGFTFKTLPFDLEKDFIPVALFGRSPFVLAAQPSSGIQSLADLIARAKAQPEKLTIATEGPKTFSGMLADTVAAMAGIRLTHVPYTKAPEAIQDVLGGRIDLICLPDAALSAYIANNQIKPLAVSTAQRVPNLPQVPSLSDTFAGFEYAGWNGLFAPANTPAEVINRVNRDIQTLLRQPEVVQRLAALGSIADSGMGTAAFAAFMKAERERWAGIVKSIGIKAE